MFSPAEMRNFELFSTAHLVTVVLFFFTYFALMYYSKKLKPYQSIIKWTLFYLLIVCEISLHVWLVLTKEWQVSDLPIQLCSLSTFLALFLFLKSNEKAFWLLFFIGTVPPILSMVTPDLIYQFPHFRFVRYFLQHAAIALAVLYFILFEGYRVPRNAILFSYVSVNIIAVPVFFLNQLLGTNFFFLANPSQTKTLLTFFGKGVMYYINLEIAAVIVFILTYIPMGILQRIENKKSRNEEKMN
ncbi:TIGR02206 family membrane protein [Bacillus sp. 165]|uniref:YwaF family protein n=1 Tax=Bacillus sp. 165 TaxID=1529117 RepID=UPI001ADBC139|nr:TIGR02206 family membrane protein [Bacillus sp. 165]MBO9128552.1 TIGR02206 family membrane protein [Bacillus sp. 165]